MKDSGFQFVNPYLEELSFMANNEFNRENTELEIENKFSVEVAREKGDNRAKVGLTWEINQEKVAEPFTLKIKMASDFKWEDDIDYDIVENMLQVNAPALLLGYMRPIVASITNSSAFPTYNLPFINFTE